MSTPFADERGSVSAFAVCVIGSLVMLGLFMFDSGRYVDTYLRTSGVAENAARIGAQSIVGIRSGQPRVDQRLATSRAQEYLQSEGLIGTVRAIGTQVEVTVIEEWSPVVISPLGNRRIIVKRRANVIDE
jgi:hypothetical protein